MDSTGDYYAEDLRHRSRLRTFVIRGRLWRLYNLLFVAAAFVWRRLLLRTTFIAITGSSGKTTAKECLYAILSAHHPAVKTRGNLTARSELPRTILRARPWHRFVVAEIGIVEPGIMWRSAWLFRPDIAVVLNVNTNHIESFRDLDTTAREKAELVKAITRRGVAVLNGDDPRVVAMARHAPGDCFFFGSSTRSVLRADAITSRWPAPLSFRVHEGASSCQVQTRLVGRHWTTAVLGAILAARRCGISLPDCASAVSVMPPYPLRMEPVVLPSGATLLRDDYNGYIDTLEAGLDILRDYEGGRSILMISQITGLNTREQNRLRLVARMAADACDVCVFLARYGAWAARRAVEAGMASDCVHAFDDLDRAVEFLRAETKPTDLILLKGRQTDALGRIVSPLLDPDPPARAPRREGARP